MFKGAVAYPLLRVFRLSGPRTRRFRVFFPVLFGFKNDFAWSKERLFIDILPQLLNFWCLGELGDIVSLLHCEEKSLIESVYTEHWI